MHAKLESSKYLGQRVFLLCLQLILQPEGELHRLQWRDDFSARRPKFLHLERRKQHILPQKFRASFLLTLSWMKYRRRSNNSPVFPKGRRGSATKWQWRALDAAKQKKNRTTRVTVDVNEQRRRKRDVLYSTYCNDFVSESVSIGPFNIWAPSWIFFGRIFFFNSLFRGPIY